MNLSNKNPFLSTTKIDWSTELLDHLKARAIEEDENVSSLIRKVMADYVAWNGPTRNIKAYRPDGSA